MNQVDRGCEKLDRCSDGKTKNAKTQQVNKLMFVTLFYDNKSPV